MEVSWAEAENIKGCRSGDVNTATLAQHMNKLLSILLCALFFLGIDALGTRKPREYLGKRNRYRLALRQALAGIVTNSTDLAKQAGNVATQHTIIKEARASMFDFYDSYLALHCREESSLDDQKKVVKGAWKIVAEHLFKLDKVDLHNGCFAADIEFPSVIYD